MSLAMRSPRGIYAAILICSLAAAAQTAGSPSTALISARAIVFNPTANKVYAVDPGRHAVAVLDMGAHSTRSVRVGDDPLAIAVNPVTNRVYVANTGSGTVSVLDGKNDAILATVNVGKRPYVLAVNVADNKVYVSNTFSDLLTIIDGATNATRTLKTGSADAIAVDSTSNQVYLLGYESNHLTVLKSDDSLSQKSAGAMHLWGMALDKAAGKLYVTRISNGDVVAMDTQSDKITPMATGRFPCAVAVNAKRGMVYVANCFDDSVTVIDGGKNKVVATVKVGSHPQAIAVDPETNLVYVANTHGDSVTVIDGANNKVMATVPAGANPYAIAVDPGSSTLYVANLSEPAFTRVDVKKLRSISH
jgi:YVTN family beta-propeller protein